MHKGVLANGDPYREFSYDYVSASVRNTKRFSSALMLLMGVNGCDLHLIDWLAENMTDKGYVSNNELTRRGFIAFHAKHKGSSNKTYGDGTVKKAFSNLVEASLLVPVVRGVFQVNPLYFYSGEDADRMKSIKLMMEFKAGVETKITVETPKI